MTVLVFGSAKGSPGVTTTVLALAARWPSHRQPLVVEADPAGGDLLARFTSHGPHHDGVRDTPSTVQLAATARSGLTDRDLLEHLQRLPGSGEVRALLAPVSPFAASSALGVLERGGLGACLSEVRGADVLVDVGRIDATSPAVPLLRSTGSVVLLTRPTFDSVVHTRALSDALRAMRIDVSLLVVGDGPYPPNEVAEAIENVGLVGVLPHDPVGARALSGEAANPKVLQRARLLRRAAPVAASLAPTPDAVDAAETLADPTESENPRPAPSTMSPSTLESVR